MRLIILLILFPLFNFFDLDDDYPFDPKREKLLKSIPAFIKRSYVEWSSKSSCIDRVLRSTPALVETKRWFTYKVRMPRRIGPVMESYLLLEFHKISSGAQVLDYSIEIHPMDRRIPKRYLKASDVVVNGTVAEMFFNLTPSYLQAKALSKKYIRLRFRFFRVANVHKMKKKTKPEFTFKAIKAFLITHEENKNCSSLISEISWQSTRFIELAKKTSLLRSHETPNLYPFDNNPKHPCQLTNWYVSFRSIGWNSFIVAPTGINARACSGVCGFPLVVNSTEHALLQTAVSLLNGKTTSVSCVPITTGSTTLVLHDNLNGGVYIIKYPNLIAERCGCL